MTGVEFPACFDSAEGYAGWCKFARIARETVSPCNDCGPVYWQKMRLQGRCNTKQVQERFTVRGDSWRAKPCGPRTT